MKLTKLMTVLAISATSMMSMTLFAEDIKSTKNDGDKIVAAQSTQAMSTGEVKKIDKEQGKITIKHGELKNLGMPPMTMIFHIKDPAMLDQVKSGQTIQFLAENINGALTITNLKVTK